MRHFLATLSLAACVGGDPPPPGAHPRLYPNTDCCRGNVYPRSPSQLTPSPDGCVVLCLAHKGCRAAVWLLPGRDAAHQCDARGQPTGGNGCCLFKTGFDTPHPSQGITAIDMGFPSPGPPPPPPPPPRPQPLPPTDLRPTYHYTRLEGEMNDPNGLMWHRLDDGTVEYHLFHQHADPTCTTDTPLPHSGVHRWGHGTSPDLVHWTRRNDSGVCGSTSGGVVLSPELANKTGWRAVILASAPTMSGLGNQSVGLHLFTSSDEHLLEWRQFVTARAQPNGDPCVICPSLVPDWTHASNIGDTFVWSEPPWNVALPPGGQRVIRVLSGSSACGPTERGGHWCGFAAGTPQTLLFSSTDLVNWSFDNVFWRGGTAADPTRRIDARGSIYTPDTFALPDGRQALVWLGAGTRYTVGTYNKSNGTFLANSASPSGGGAAETHGAFHCGQSVTDASGRRVQFGWLALDIAGAGYTGAQSLPRVVSVAPPTMGGPSKLMFAPLPELAMLHDPTMHRVVNTTVPAGDGTNRTMLGGVDKATGLRMHTALVVRLARNDTVALCVLCGLPADASPGVEVLVSVSGSTGAVSVALAGDAMPLAPTPAGPDGRVEVRLDVYVDGALVELFVNGGEETASHGSKAVTAFGVGLAAAAAAPVPVSTEMWRMMPSVQ